jgi:hypothetical protein
MPKKMLLFAFTFYGLALVLWQLLFNSHSVLSPILWEIHTIFTSVIVFYIAVNSFVAEKVLDVVKILFRILFKVWFVIFIAFTLKKSFDIKGFLLTATFVFGYLEGMIDLNSWFRNQNSHFIFRYFKAENNSQTRIPLCVFSVSLIHIFSALIAFVFFYFK